MIPLVIIAGPTASGKTALSIELAKRLNGEIVSADSMQIYKYMNIGTAKPSKEEMCGIPHHMLDFQDPAENFSVADYCTMAHKVIADIFSRGKLPILVGGTGLYIDSLAQNVDFGEVTENPTLRAELQKQADEEGGRNRLFEELRQIDPETAAKYHPNNIRRIIRAIEFYKVTGKTITEQAQEEKPKRYDSIYFCIDFDRNVLYERINKRVDIMIEAGLEDEVASLMKYGKHSTAMQGIGYKEFFDYFEGKLSLAETIELIKMNSRRYAKRQLTWFRRNKDIHMLKFSDSMADTAENIIREHFNK